MTSTKFIVVLLLITVNAICSEACSRESKPEPKPAPLKAVAPCNCQCPKPTPCPVMTTSRPIYNPAQFSKSQQPPQNSKPFSYQPPAYNPNSNSTPAQSPNSEYNPLTPPIYSGYYPDYQYPNYPSYPGNVPPFSGSHENEEPKNPQPSNNEAVKPIATPIGFGFEVIKTQHNRTEKGWSKHTSSGHTW
ncbi:extensin-like [Cotesia glomerata]|uniref:Uncharacterized protein n=1 Tax=Cotesia glomerata TaxID=32391 RepID=A0AAV7HRP1_COTGL|nr:extensin-like [Cotesia glomerata]KAH0534535.1 hypothetical protein KQX54_004944 [Cotesia glomerata]